MSLGVFALCGFLLFVLLQAARTISDGIRHPKPMYDSRREAVEYYNSNCASHLRLK